MRKALFLLFLILAGANQVALSETNNIDAPTYLVSTEVNYAPFVYLNNQGNVAGFDVDILSAIAEDQGFNVRFLPTGWDKLFEKVTSGETDIIASAIAETKERKEIFDLSDPYLKTYRVAVIGNPKFSQFSQIEQLSGLKFATQPGSSNEGYLKTLFGDDVNIHEVNTQFQGILAALSGEADAAYDDYHVVLPYLNRKKYKEKIIKIIPDDKVGTNLSLVFMVKKGRLDLLSKINEGLKNIKNNGTFQKIYDQYFSVKEQQ